MKIATLVAVVFTAVASIPLLAQQAGATAQQNATANAAGTQAGDSMHARASANPESKHTNGAANGVADVHGTQGAIGFGDEAASHAWEMSSVNGELEGKLDSRTAKAGDRVVLKTTDKVMTPDGTVIPRGSRLIGQITEVQAHDQQHGAAQMGIAFDRAELKNGQNFAIYTLIRGAHPAANTLASLNSDDTLDAPTSGESMAGGGQVTSGARAGGGGGGLLGGAGRTVGGVGNAADGTLDRTAATTLGDHADAAVGAATDSAVQTAGHGDLGFDGGAHNAAAVRAIPHATGIPGVMLAGNSSASGVFSAPKGDVRFESGTQMQLGIVADR